MKKLIQFELRKIFSKRLTQIALLFVLFFSAILGFSSYQNKYAFDGVSKEGTGKTAVEIDKEIAAKYEGVLTDEKVQQMMNDFAAQTNLHGMNAAYLYHNALQSAVFTRFSDMNGNWNGVRVSDAFGGEEVRIGYVDGWLTTSQNMVKIFFILSLVIVIMTAPVFCGEYGGVDNIILTSRYGRTKCGAAKVGAGLIAAFIVTLAVAAVNILFAFVLYGRDGLNCSVLFAPMPFDNGYIPFNITCGTLLKYQVLVAFTGTLSVAGITLLISAISRNQMVALVASAAVYFFPAVLPISESNPLFRFIGLLPMYHAQFVSLMSIEQMDNGILYAIWVIPTAFIFIETGAFASRRFFANHQVT